MKVKPTETAIANMHFPALSRLFQLYRANNSSNKQHSFWRSMASISEIDNPIMCGTVVVVE